jgi:hypothetical protein
VWVSDNVVDGRGRPVPALAPDEAVLADAPTVAALLHGFNVEFAEPSPGPDVLAGRLNRLLAGDCTIALLGGEAAVGFALVTLRSNVWYDAHVALLDGLYVVPAMRPASLPAPSSLRGPAVSVGRPAQC